MNIIAVHGIFKCRAKWKSGGNFGLNIEFTSNDEDAI